MCAEKVCFKTCVQILQQKTPFVCEKDSPLRCAKNWKNFGEVSIFKYDQRNPEKILYSYSFVEKLQRNPSEKLAKLGCLCFTKNQLFVSRDCIVFVVHCSV